MNIVELPIELAYGENKNQNPATLESNPKGENDDLAMHKLYRESGHEGYINIADGDTIIQIMSTLAEAFRRNYDGKVPYIAIAGKHGNPCGGAIDWKSPIEAINKSLAGDARAVMGGEVVTNFIINAKEAKELLSVNEKFDIGRLNWGLDIIFAPQFSGDAIQILGKKKGRRLMSNPALESPFISPEEWMIRPVRGGFLKQKAPRFIYTNNEVEELTGKTLGDADFDTLLLAWAICWNATSNTVALAKDRMLIGLGCGQQDRIACVRLCLDRAAIAGHDTKGSIFASDAFFPYATSECKFKFLNLISALIKDLASLIPMGRNLDARQSLAKIATTIVKNDNREGPELLADSGCIGGIVPADGNRFEEVKKFFEQRELSVAFVNKLNRGFSKH